jgi:hypothetical protein
MFDHDAGHLALRTRARALVVATTGSMALAATTSGYTRADGGSFITDGFREGMEILVTGFAANGYRVVREVAAATLTTEETLTAEISAGSRTIVAGLPETRFWENEKATRSGVQIATATPDRPYVEEEFVPATHTLVGGPRSGGEVTETGLYVIRWYGLANRGPHAIRRSVKALLALFTPATTLAAGSHTLRVSADTAPWAGAIRTLDNGWAVCTVTIPWWVMSTNSIAA